MDLVLACGHNNTAQVMLVDRYDNEDVEKHNGYRIPDHFTLLKLIVETCISKDTTSLSRYPQRRPLHGKVECLFQFYSKPNALTVDDLSDVMQTYMDDVLLHTGKATRHDNLLEAFVKCTFAY